MTDKIAYSRGIAPDNKLRLREAMNESSYWRTLSCQEHIAALEQIREEHQHWKADAQPGFRRVYSIIKR